MTQSMGLFVGTRGSKPTPFVLPESLRVVLGKQSPVQFWGGGISCPLQTCTDVFLLPPLTPGSEMSGALWSLHPSRVTA